jgi:hypothetical protein
MPYGKTDELAINTIRTLAVRQMLMRCFECARCCPTIVNSYPASSPSPNRSGSSVYGAVKNCFERFNG